MFSNLNMQIESALGDGNCAFNSIILAFANEEVLNSIENLLVAKNQKPDDKFKTFIQMVAEPLDIKLQTEKPLEGNKVESKLQAKAGFVNWNTVKESLLFFKKNEPEWLQKTLSKVFRKFAIEQIENIPSLRAFHCEKTREALTTEFEIYCNRTFEKQAATSKEVGDIFIRHEFISKKFKEIYDENHLGLRDCDIDTDAIKRLINECGEVELKKWWSTQGHELFLKNMKETAKSASDVNLYAGDLELMPIAMYFDINLEVYSTKFPKALLVNSGHGEIPMSETKFTKNEIRELNSRGVIEIREREGKIFFVLQPLSREEVVKRLGSVADEAAIKDLLVKDEKKIVTAFSVDRAKSSIDELIMRSVISPTSKTWNLTHKDDVLLRIQSHPQKDEFLRLWDKYYRNCATLRLCNKGGSHWDNLIKLPPKKEVPDNKNVEERLPDSKPELHRNGLFGRYRHRGWENFDRYDRYHYRMHDFY